MCWGPAHWTLTALGPSPTVLSLEHRNFGDSIILSWTDKGAKAKAAGHVLSATSPDHVTCNVSTEVLRRPVLSLGKVVGRCLASCSWFTPERAHIGPVGTLDQTQEEGTASDPERALSALLLWTSGYQGAA